MVSPAESYSLYNSSLSRQGITSSISVIAAGLFFLGTLSGEYTLIERVGGAGWVFLLSMIILMPIVTPIVKKRRQGRNSTAVLLFG